MNRQQAENMFKKELENGTINTETTPHYDSFNEYVEMLIDSGFVIEKEKGWLSERK